MNAMWFASRPGNILRFALIAVLAVALSGCGLFGGKRKQEITGPGVPRIEGSTLGVNAYLWRAALDTLAFMPLASTDSAGGIIVTDWYSPPKVPGERMKVTVYIMDLRLRADAIRVAVFRQIRGKGGAWQDATVQAGTAERLEDAILTRARQLRIAAVDSR